MSETRVVNIRDLPRDPAKWPADHVYIGRVVPWRGLRRSIWANPYRIGAHGDRGTVLRLYEQSVLASPGLMVRLGELRGKTLVCWCKPDACHGDVLARLADGVPVVTS